MPHEHPEVRPRLGALRVAALASVGLALAVGTGCDYVQKYIGGEPDLAPAKSKAASGDLPGAAAAFDEAAAKYPDSADAAVGKAWGQLLSGDTAGAEATLAAAQKAAPPEKVPELELRRALVALQADNLDEVKAHGEASGMPAGKLLAAEVYLVDLESDKAAAILRDLQGTDGQVGAVAKQYVAMLDSGNQHLAGLAEATALYVLGDHGTACENAEELVKALPSENADKGTLLLLWAGRAATSDKPVVAYALLDELEFPPEGQAWRVQATRAIALAAEGKTAESVALFDALVSAEAPGAGVADARATACMVAKDADAARSLATGLESAAAARCLQKAGLDGAADRAPDGALKQWLENPS